MTSECLAANSPRKVSHPREGVSVRELARRTGLSLATVRRLRNVAKSGTIATWFSIADALGVDVIEFFDERG